MGTSIPVKAFDLEAAALYGRLAAYARATRLDLSRFLEWLAPFGPELAELAMITVPDRFDRMAVTAQIARSGDGVDRLLGLVRAHQPEQAERLAALAGAETGEVNLELETVPGDVDGLTVTVHALGRRRLDDDLARLAGFGVPAASVGELRELAMTLGGDDRLIGLGDRAGSDGTRWSLQVAHHNRDAAERAATRGRLDAAAAALAATDAQRHLVEALHDVFAGGRDSYALLRVDRGGVARELGVMWSGVAWEHVVRMMIGFHPGTDAAARLGELAGAFDADVASAVELVLGPTEPPRMRVAATVIGGRSHGQ